MNTQRWAMAAAAGLAAGLLTLPVVSREADTFDETVLETTQSAPSCPANARSARLDFTLKDLDGKDVRVQDYRGKVILLNFWASWCGPCKYEIPAFVELQEKYRPNGFAVLGVLTQDTIEAARPFVKKYGINYPILISQDALEEEYGPVWALPMSILISRDGKVCAKLMGLRSKEQFERNVKSLL